MTTYTPVTKNAPPGLTPYSAATNNAISALVGRPIGLLLSLTYAETLKTQFSTFSKSSTSYSTINKN